MAEYKCISCGEVKESESSCSCPMCGYKMFEMPYERKNVLASEIDNFISHLEVTTVVREDLIFEGKEKDDARFPDYDKILKYVSSQVRTEGFQNNLLETAEQLKIHFTSQFSKTYPISFENLNGIIKEYEEILIATAEVLVPGTKIELPELTWDEASLLYAENQNRYLWFSANELIDLIEKLAKKIVKFIKVNNLYGNNHKYHPKKRGDQYTDNTEFKYELENAISKAEDILGKKYVLDIADDGSNELKEMLTCLWNSIELIMCAPLFIKSYDYMTESGCISEKEFFESLSAKLQERYKDFNTAIQKELLINLASLYRRAQY